jgi:hypothetical protein
MHLYIQLGQFKFQNTGELWLKNLYYRCLTQLLKYQKSQYLHAFQVLAIVHSLHHI